MLKGLIKKYIPYWLRIKIVYSLPFCFFSYKYWLPDKKYITWMYKKRFGVKLNIEKPISFNEKNNWRKLYDRKPIYTEMVDKYKIKNIVKERLGSDFTFPLLAVWDEYKKIDIKNLPDKFVLKCNHAGGVIICRDKSAFNLSEAKKELKLVYKRSYYAMSREWPYKNVERKIICETYMGEELTDYKVYCFNGEPKFIFVWKNASRDDGRKPSATFLGVYDFEWKRVESIMIDYPSLNIPAERPGCLEELKRCAIEMSKETLFVRVDCYIVENHVYIGELTFFPWGGFMKFIDNNTDIKLGKMLRLPITNILKM